jgi:O-antigen ligase
MFWQIKYLIVYVLLQNFNLTDEMARRIRIAIFLAIGIQAILAIAQQLTGGMLGLYVFGEQDPTKLFFAKGDLRISGTLGATNGFGGYMAMLLVAVLPFMFRERNLLRYAVYGAGMIALLMTFSRAGWLSFVCGALLVVLVLVRASVIRFTRIMMLGVLGVLLLGIGITSYYEGIQERFEDKDAISSAEGRLTQFSQMWPAIEKHPLVGIGPGVTEYFGAWNNNAHYIREKLPDIWLGNQPHSSQLQIWIESGTPAFILFMIMLVMIFRAALVKPGGSTENREVLFLRIGTAAAAAAAMIDASFGTEINSYQISIPFWILLGISRNRSQPVFGRGLNLMPISPNRSGIG